MIVIKWENIQFISKITHHIICIADLLAKDNIH